MIIRQGIVRNNHFARRAIIRFCIELNSVHAVKIRVLFLKRNVNTQIRQMLLLNTTVDLKLLDVYNMLTFVFSVHSK